MWENRQETGFIKAYSATLQKSMLEPQRFYEDISPEGTYDQPLFYALLCMCLGTFFTLFYQFVFRSFFTMLGTFLPSPAVGAKWSLAFYFMIALSSMILAPLFCSVQLFINAAVYHFFLWLLGAAPKGFVATFRALSYSQGPQLLLVIPFAGAMIAWVWQMIILYNGFRKLQNASQGQSLAAILLPFLLMCIFSFMMFFGVLLLVFFMISLMSRASYGV